MDPFRLTGFVYPVKKTAYRPGPPWRLLVNLPSEPAFDSNGQPGSGHEGQAEAEVPEETKVIRQRRPPSDCWRHRFERSWNPIAPSTPIVFSSSELLDRWLEATRGEMRVASYNSYRRIRLIHVDPALGQVLAGKLTRAQLSTYYAAKMRGGGRRSRSPRPRSRTTTPCSRPPTTGRSRRSSSS